MFDSTLANPGQAWPTLGQADIDRPNFVQAHSRPIVVLDWSIPSRIRAKGGPEFIWLQSVFCTDSAALSCRISRHVCHKATLEEVSVHCLRRDRGTSRLVRVRARARVSPPICVCCGASALASRRGPREEQRRAPSSPPTSTRCCSRRRGRPRAPRRRWPSSGRSPASLTRRPSGAHGLRRQPARQAWHTPLPPPFGGAPAAAASSGTRRGRRSRVASRTRRSSRSCLSLGFARGPDSGGGGRPTSWLEPASHKPRSLHSFRSVRRSKSRRCASHQLAVGVKGLASGGCHAAVSDATQCSHRARHSTVALPS